jgi:hypothetical protein
MLRAATIIGGLLLPLGSHSLRPYRPSFSSRTSSEAQNERASVEARTGVTWKIGARIPQPAE